MPDDELIRRVVGLHRRLEARRLARRGLSLNEQRFSRARSWSTVSIVEARTPSGTVRIVTTNDGGYYRLLSEAPDRWLQPGEQLGSRPTLVYGAKENGKRGPRIRIHAEQLGVNDARALGARTGRIASSNLGCDDQCVSLLRDEFPGFRHVNPQRPGTQPPPIPEDAPLRARGRGGVSGPRRAAGAPERATTAASRASVPRAVARAPLRPQRLGAIAAEGRGAAALGARVLVRSAGRLAASLIRSAVFVIGLFGLDIVFLAFTVWMMLEEARREEALQRAIEEAVRTRLPDRLRALMESRGDEVADYFLGHWGRPSGLFLYLSPVMDITSLPGRAGERYRFNVEFNDDGPVAARWVSSHPLEPEFEESTIEIDAARFRWSIPFPLFTPFDAYLAYLDMVAEIFSRSWWAAAQRGALSPTTNQQLAELAQQLSTVAALLRMDQYAGFAETEPFQVRQAIVDRRALIMRIADLVRQDAAPLAERLERKGVLDPDVVVVQIGPESSIVHGRLRQLIEGEPTVSRYLLRLAADLSSIPDRVLGYRRRDRVDVVRRFFQERAFKADYFAALTADVQEHVPKALRAPSLDTSRVVGEIQLQPIEEGEE